MYLFGKDKAMITVMVQANNPVRIKELMDKSVLQGAEAFGMQFEQMCEEYKTEDIFRELFAYAKDIPTYATNYRSAKNNGKSDEQLAKELIFIADCGAEICDVMGDYFDITPGELTMDKTAIDKQMDLIDKLHNKGAKVLMSSHVLKYIPAEEVLKIAMEHQSRGADICKIVTGADTMEQQLENLKIIDMLKEKLDIPFLFLCGGNCGLLRRIGGELGCCMYLCVEEYDDLATVQQPLLKDIKIIRDTIKV